MPTPDHVLDDASRAAVWGDLFEIAVKRGCLGLLEQRGLLQKSATTRDRWAALVVNDLHQHLSAQAGVVDPVYRARQDSSLDHMLWVGWALGWTSMREYLDRLGPRDLEVRGVFCPLELKDRAPGAVGVDSTERLESIWRELGLPGDPDEHWAGKGEPANADFLLITRTPERHHVLCLEFSLYAPLDDRDFETEASHLDELMRYIQRIESRGVFTRIAAEVTGEQFTLSDRLMSHLPALTNHDKPLFKLCQGSSYATRLIHLLNRRDQGLEPVTAQVIAVTSAGLEALSAPFDSTGNDDHRAHLMRSLGDAYRRGGSEYDDRSAVNQEIAAVQAQVARSLPSVLRTALDESLCAPPTDRHIDVRQQERVPAFVNPGAKKDRQQLLRCLDDVPSEVDALLGGDARRAVLSELDSGADSSAPITLRNLHGAAIRAGLRAAQPGQITVVAAEGHPGIGKTTAVLRHLTGCSDDDGFLFLYASPRIVINSQVTTDIATRPDGHTSGVLALTTNSRLVGAARQWWQQIQRSHETGHQDRWVDGAVIVDGVDTFQEPAGSILFLDPIAAQTVDEDYASNSLKKETWGEREDVLSSAANPGVLNTLARATRAALEANPHINRVALTAAVQGFRDMSNATSTVERLSQMFRYAADSPRGVEERRALAERIPTIIVMVDEIAGDGAGSPFVHAIAQWLHREFIEPFISEAHTSPFTVALVLADASLGNDQVLHNYLLNDVEAPEKVLVSHSQGPRPFRLAAGRLRLGGRLMPVLHVMADGFPAATLTLDYHLRLTPVVSRPEAATLPKSPRAVIREQRGDALLRQVVEEVFDALEHLPARRQVILFVQDKLFLRNVRTLLLHPEQLADLAENQAPIDTHGIVLDPDDIGLLDGSVSEWQRRQLVEPCARDGKRVFLMTSSGSRGVSFPLATTIIASVPRFAVESGFMEIAQLVYRGRGFSEPTGINGDRLDRRIVLLLQDFVVADEPIDDRTWLRRKLDLISALVLLRATLLTRITGDADIVGQRAAVVPVGRIGTDESGTSLSLAVRRFMDEGKIYLTETVPPYLRKLVMDALADTEVLFRDFRWTVRPNAGQPTVADRQMMARLRGQVCSPASSLLPRAAALPPDAFAVGAVLIERWRDGMSHEAFRFDALVDRHDARKRQLVDACWQIGKGSELPGPLRRAARDVLAVLERPEDLQQLDFLVRKTNQSRHAWGLLPVDYTRFAQPPAAGDDARQGRLEEPEIWLEGLTRSATATVSPSGISPVLPYYKAHPYVALLARGDATGLERVFDDRYFMASTELNLLNTLLFAKP